MSDAYLKLLARHELIRRRTEQVESNIRRVARMSDQELEAILLEPNEVKPPVLDEPKEHNHG